MPDSDLETGDTPPRTASHIDHTISSLASLRRTHEKRSSTLQKAADYAIDRLGRPVVLVILTALIATWIIVNLLAPHLGWPQPDPPPFFWLEGTVSVVALYLVVLVLASQRREDELEQRRQLLNLDIAISSEQKTAKVIALLEELRRDSPHLPDRIDGEANRMAVPSNPHSAVDIVRDADLEGESTRD